ncbi:methyl-accepting chemotaxis protein [Rhizobium sp. BK176]|nr:methyl-accepting chemotaxis protein [Rhizobium sp. BK661]MCS4093683.1 methyl-accepting chemotaxis protein [Rhizobium sp. BK176]
MVEETTAASHALVSEVGRIAKMLGEFNSGEPSSRPQPEPARSLAAKTQNMAVRGMQAKVANKFASLGSVAVARDRWEEF